MDPFAVGHDQQLAEREEAIANARAALRAEREQVAADRAEADRLLAEARAAAHEANRTRNRTRNLAARFVSRISHEYDQARRKLECESDKLKADRQRLADEVARLEKVRSDFHLNAAEVRDRLGDSWAAVRAQQKRMAREWIDACRHLAEETELVHARARELDERERNLTDAQARAEAETAGFREEEAALETRIHNTRQSLAELEAQRDRVRAELLGAELNGELVADVESELGFGSGGERDAPATQANLSPATERPAADCDDRERLVSEQLTMLAEARARWRQAEELTLVEMEQLARELDQRECQLNQREQRLIRAGIRQREEAYSLWRLRLRLEAWQTKQAAFEMRWRTEREQLEADLSRRLGVITRRETDLDETFANLEKVRTRERERLRAELDLWADDRARLEQARLDFDRQHQELLSETARHAAKALAVEMVLSKSAPGKQAVRAARRLSVLRRRWEWVFERKVREASYLRAELAMERARVEERYRQLHAVLLQTTEAAAAMQSREADLVRQRGSAIQELASTAADSSGNAAIGSAELASLRNEVERLALLLLEMEQPEPLEPTPGDIPWADESPKTPASDLLPFDSGSWAA